MAGKRVIGGGASIGLLAPSQVPLNLVLRASMPETVSGADVWFASATEEHPVPGNWQLLSTAVCANVVSPPSAPSTPVTSPSTR